MLLLEKNQPWCCHNNNLASRQDAFRTFLSLIIWLCLSCFIPYILCFVLFSFLFFLNLYQLVPGHTSGLVKKMNNTIQLTVFSVLLDSEKLQAWWCWSDYSSSPCKDTDTDKMNKSEDQKANGGQISIEKRYYAMFFVFFCDHKKHILQVPNMKKR